MALAANEVEQSGFVRDKDNGRALVTTTTTTGAKFHAGFLRDPDGRLVVTNG